MTSTANIITRLRSTTRRSVAVAATLAVGATLASASAADAAGPRPHFQMPVACGQMWEATTYADHWPDPDSIDLGMWDADDNNISEGEPALASADGVVQKVYKASNDENRVFLDHGNGWVTHYIHLESVPPLKVGQAVAQGEQVGRIGRSGADEFHLHYSQIADGEAVRIQFNGASIATHQGDESSWGKWPSRTGEQLTSNNCPGRSFLPFDQGNQHHVFAYEAARGAAGIASIANNASGVTNPWGTPDMGSRRWTHFMPFTLNGQQRFISYGSSTGAVQFNGITTNGPAKLSGGTWGKGWTHLMPFSLGGQPYYVAYNSLTGAANVDRINAAGTGSSTLTGGSWTKGWTQLVPFRLGGVQHFLTYRGGTGEVKINKVTGSGNNVTITNVWQETWTTGWTQIVPITHNGAVHMLRYKQSSGQVSLDKVKPAAQGIENRGVATWTKTWTTMSPFTLGQTGHVLLYKNGSGQATILKLNATGSALSTTSNMSWTLGLA